MKNPIIILAVVGIISTMGIILFSFKTEEINNNKIKAVVYKSPTCSCCKQYVPYIKEKGFAVETIVTDKLDEIKDKYNIPQDMESCHTTIVGNYFIEGHVPIEAVNKLLAEKPDIDGISLPNMPAGSPGMGGTKKESWTIYGIKDGEVSEFIVL